MNIEFETTIKRGLPIKVRAYIWTYKPYESPHPIEAEIEDVFWKNGGDPMHEGMWERYRDRLQDEALEKYEEERWAHV